MKQTLVLDFTQRVETEIAVMPANLAKKLLAKYAESLTLVPTEIIIGEFLDSIRTASKEGLAVAAGVARVWAEERELIENIAKGNWDAYKTTPTKTDVIVKAEDTSFMGDVPEGVKVIGKINLDDTFGGPHRDSSVGV